MNYGNKPEWDTYGQVYQQLLRSDPLQLSSKTFDLKCNQFTPNEDIRHSQCISSQKRKSSDTFEDAEMKQSSTTLMNFSNDDNPQAITGPELCLTRNFKRSEVLGNITHPVNLLDSESSLSTKSNKNNNEWEDLKMMCVDTKHEEVEYFEPLEATKFPWDKQAHYHSSNYESEINNRTTSDLQDKRNKKEEQVTKKLKTVSDKIGTQSQTLQQHSRKVRFVCTYTFESKYISHMCIDYLFVELL